MASVERACWREREREGHCRGRLRERSAAEPAERSRSFGRSWLGLRVGRAFLDVRACLCLSVRVRVRAGFPRVVIHREISLIAPSLTRA